MKKNPNKAAGNWGALKTKPQNLVPFQVGGKVTVTAGGEKHVIYKKTTKRGEGKVGNVMVNHPTKDKGVWDTIDLTKKSGAKTIQQGVASTKKWHKENPYNDMKKQLTKKQMGGNSPKVKTKTVTTNPGGYSKTIVKTKTVDRPGKQGTVSTTKTRPTIKGVASDYASGVRKSVYGFKEAIDNKRTEMKKTRVARDMKKAGISPRPINPEQGGPMKKGGSVKKYQVGGPKTKAMEGQFKNTPPTGSNPLKKPNVLDNGVYRGPKVTPAQIKQSQEDWKKKEKEMTNPNNKPAGSPIRQLKKGGTIKKKK